VSDDCGALALIIGHYLHDGYNHTPHESLDGQTPYQRFYADTQPLRFAESDAALRECFVVTERRKVSADHIISVDSVDYEVPRGHAGTWIEVFRRVLTDELLVLHDGQPVTLHPVDLAFNAVDRRAQPAAPPPDDDHGAPRTAAAIAFARDFGPVVGPDGGVLPTRSTKGIAHGENQSR
jgi:hypothetical protein